MKALLLLTMTGILFLTGCATVIDEYGNKRTVLSPEGAAILETAVAAGTGVAVGAVMQNSNSMATGAVASSVGSVVERVTRSVIAPYSQTRYNQYPQQQPVYGGQKSPPAYGAIRQQPVYNGVQQQPVYTGVPHQPVSSGVVYVRLPDGSFVPVQQ